LEQGDFDLKTAIKDKLIDFNAIDYNINPLRRHIAVDIVLGMMHLVKNNVYHRDLKSSNVILKWNEVRTEKTKDIPIEKQKILEQMVGSQVD